MTKKRTQAPEPFTATELAAVQAAALAVWNHVGGDCLQAMAEERGKPVERVTIPRADVMEIVLDADRTEEELRRRRSAPELLAKVRDSGYEELLAAIRPAFPHARYGL
jgi:hypothetical protein